MRTIETSNAFKKDYRRVKSMPRHRDIDALLEKIVHLLAHDIDLPVAHKDHLLTGNWKQYRECHIKPDLLLIYKVVHEDILRLARLGSHAELFS